MKKIINGKKYNTETAKLIDERTYSNPSDFNYVKESLYVKKTGELFLHGDGGAASPYAKRSSSNSWYGSEGIIPLTEREAMSWMEKYSTVELFEQTFGEVAE